MTTDFSPRSGPPQWPNVGQKPIHMPPADHSISVLEAKVDALVRQSIGLGDDLKQLTKAVTQLAVFEERQANDRASIGRAFSEIEANQHRIDVLERGMDLRIKALENKGPISDFASGTVLKVIAIIIAAVLAANLGGLLRPHPAQAPFHLQSPTQ